MVTIEGESLNPGGSMTGGAFKNNSNLLGRRREIEELERSVELLKKELQELQKEIGDNRSRRNVLRDAIADFQEKLRQQYVEQNTAGMNLKQLEEKEADIQKSYGQIDREKEELRRQAVEIRQIIPALQRNWRLLRGMRRNWKPLLKPNRKNWRNGRLRKHPKQRSWRSFVWKNPLCLRKNTSFRKT